MTGATTSAPSGPISPEEVIEIDRLKAACTHLRSAAEDEKIPETRRKAAEAALAILDRIGEETSENPYFDYLNLDEAARGRVARRLSDPRVVKLQAAINAPDRFHSRRLLFSRDLYEALSAEADNTFEEMLLSLTASVYGRDDFRLLHVGRVRSSEGTRSYDKPSDFGANPYEDVASNDIFGLFRAIKDINREDTDANKKEATLAVGKRNDKLQILKRLFHERANLQSVVDPLYKVAIAIAMNTGVFTDEEMKILHELIAASRTSAPDVIVTTENLEMKLQIDREQGKQIKNIQQAQAFVATLNSKIAPTVKALAAEITPLINAEILDGKKLPKDATGETMFAGRLYSISGLSLADDGYVYSDFANEDAGAKRANQLWSAVADGLKEENTARVSLNVLKTHLSNDKTPYLEKLGHLNTYVSDQITDFRKVLEKAKQRLAVLNAFLAEKGEVYEEAQRLIKEAADAKAEIDNLEKPPSERPWLWTNKKFRATKQAYSEKRSRLKAPINKLTANLSALLGENFFEPSSADLPHEKQESLRRSNNVPETLAEIARGYRKEEMFHLHRNIESSQFRDLNGLKHHYEKAVNGLRRANLKAIFDDEIAEKIVEFIATYDELSELHQEFTQLHVANSTPDSATS